MAGTRDGSGVLGDKVGMSSACIFPIDELIGITKQE